MSDTPRTDAVAERLVPLADSITLDNVREVISTITATLLLHSGKLERELANLRRIAGEMPPAAADQGRSIEDCMEDV